MRSFTAARPIKRRAFDVRKKRDQSRVSDAEIIAILQQWLGVRRRATVRTSTAHCAASARRTPPQSPPNQSAPPRRPLCQREAAMKIAAVYEAVTRSIIAELEQGAAPWVKPWKGGARTGIMPANAVTGRLLQRDKYPDPVARGRRARLPHPCLAHLQAGARKRRVRPQGRERHAGGLHQATVGEEGRRRRRGAPDFHAARIHRVQRGTGGRSRCARRRRPAPAAARRRGRCVCRGDRRGHPPRRRQGVLRPLYGLHRAS